MEIEEILTLFSPGKPVESLDVEGFDLQEFSEKIRPWRERSAARCDLLFEPVGQDDFFFHKVMREGNAKVCLLLLKTVDSFELSSEGLFRPDFEGRNGLQVAIFRKDPLPPKVLFYFITKLYSFEAMATALKSNFKKEEDAIDYLPRKAGPMVLQAVVDRCLLELNSILDDPLHGLLLTENQKTAQRFLREIDKWHDYFSETRKWQRKLFFSLTPQAVNYNPEAFLSFFEALIPNDLNNFGNDTQDAQWLAHIELALNVVEKKEQYGDRLLALKIRLLYFSFQLLRVQKNEVEQFVGVDINYIIASILEIHSFENIDADDCAMMAEIFSLTSSDSEAFLEPGEKFDDFSKDNILFRKRLRCLHAAVQQGRMECAPLLHGLLGKINKAKVEKINLERWEEEDEQRFQFVMEAEDVLNQKRHELKASVSFKLFSINSTTPFERKVTIEEIKFQEKESREDNERYREACKQAKRAVCHWKYHEKVQQEWQDSHQHEFWSEQTDLKNFPVQIFSFDFEDFKEQNVGLAKYAQHSLSAAHSLTELERKFKEYLDKFELLEKEFFLKIKNIRNLKKILAYEEKSLLINRVKEANQYQKKAKEEVKEEEVKANSHPSQALQSQLYAPCSRESLDQAIKAYKEFQSQSTREFLLKRGIRANLESEIARLQERSEITMEKEKSILEKRITKIKNFLEQRLPEKNESVMKKYLIDLSKEMEATAPFLRWARSYLPCFFKSQGELLLYNLANELRNESEEAAHTPPSPLTSSPSQSG
ncbi:MAG: hypothetical protein K0S27_996 [Gammaproteobacteria bacterium]|nr:hypothetical protein [Gammaproteobacteria bacterium]